MERRTDSSSDDESWETHEVRSDIGGDGHGLVARPQGCEGLSLQAEKEDNDSWEHHEVCSVIGGDEHGRVAQQQEGDECIGGVGYSQGSQGWQYLRPPRGDGESLEHKKSNTGSSSDEHEGAQIPPIQQQVNADIEGPQGGERLSFLAQRGGDEENYVSEYPRGPHSEQYGGPPHGYGESSEYLEKTGGIVRNCAQSPSTKQHDLVRREVRGSQVERRWAPKSQQDGSVYYQGLHTQYSGSPPPGHGEDSEHEKVKSGSIGGGYSQGPRSQHYDSPPCEDQPQGMTSRQQYGGFGSMVLPQHYDLLQGGQSLGLSPSQQYGGPPGRRPQGMAAKSPQEGGEGNSNHEDPQWPHSQYFGRPSPQGQRRGMAPKQQYGSCGGMAPQHYGGPWRGQPREIAPHQRYCGPPGGHTQPHQQYGSPFFDDLRGETPWQRGGSVGWRGRDPSGPSRLSYPDLHQATHIPQQPPTTLTEPSLTTITQQLHQPWLQPEEASTTGQGAEPVVLPITLMRIPTRPGKGHIGARCIVKANHFFAELPEKDVHHYNVSITPGGTTRGVNRAVMEQLVKSYSESHLGKRLPVYDGQKSMFTAGPLPFISKVFAVTLFANDDGTDAPRKEKNFKVNIKYVSHVDLHHLGLFLQGKHADAPQEALKVLDIVLRELPTSRYTTAFQSFYSPDLGRRCPLGKGLESWRGFYQSIRPTQMGLSLNIDMLSTAFIEPLPVIEFVCQLLNKDASRPLSDVDRVKIKKTLRGMKVEVTYRGNLKNMRRPHPTKVVPSSRLYNTSKRPTILCFNTLIGLVCKWEISKGQIICPWRIVEGQRYSKSLSEKQVTSLLKVTCQRPYDRERDIVEAVHHNDYDEDPYAKEFGLKISNKLAAIEARILPTPVLKYSDEGIVKDCRPHIGQWNMLSKKMYKGGRVNNWICMNFSRTIQESAASVFCYELAKICQNHGVTFNPEPILPPFSSHPDQVEGALKALYHDAIKDLQLDGKELDLLVVILPDNNGSLYGDVKRICETDLGLVSQCCLTKQVFKMSRQYMTNLALKINVKVGGKNTALLDAVCKRIPLVCDDQPTIIFGADVTHPHPGEDSSPSIAAVVASQDWPDITKYVGLVSAQTHRQEVIVDLYKEWKDPLGRTVIGGMIRELLMSFYTAAAMKPQRIIIYRDVVSDGQFHQVLFHELDAIRKACASLHESYQPPVTFVVVKKRHHTRLFANNHNDRRTVDNSGNILPGTIVDSKICHPTEFDFYLCSHAGIQGTSRPAHYHVMWDENKFSADDFQSFTYNLCYTYARCTRSVSIVPPAYYAHLAAHRARFYVEKDTYTDSISVSGARMRAPGSNTRAPGAGAVRPLPEIKDSVKKVMFYC